MLMRGLSASRISGLRGSQGSSTDERILDSLFPLDEDDSLPYCSDLGSLLHRFEDPDLLRDFLTITEITPITV
jgi:hypothetical protein